MISRLKSLLFSTKSQREMGRKGLIGSRRRLTSGDTLTGAAEHSRILSVLMLVAIWGVCVSILIFHKEEVKDISLVLGQQAPNTEFSELPVFDYEDVEATDKLRQEAMATVPMCYNISTYSINRSIGLADNVFALLEKRLRVSTTDKSTVVAEEKGPAVEIIGKILPAGIAAMNNLVENPDQKQKYLAVLTSELEMGIMAQKDRDSLKLGQQMRLIDVKGRIRKPRLLVEISTPEKAAENVADEIIKYYSGPDRDDFRKALITLSLELIGPDGDLVYNKQTTEKWRQEAAAEVIPVVIKYKKDQPLIRRNEVVTAKVLSMLSQYHETLKKSRIKVNFWENFTRVGLVCLFLMLMTGIYIYHIHPEVARSNQRIWIAGTVIIVSVLINHSVMNLFNFLCPILNISPYWIRDLMPLALPSIILSVTIGLRVAVYAGFYVAAIAAMMMGDSFDLVLKGMLVSCLAGFMVRYSSNYKSFFARIVLAVFLGFSLLESQLFTIQAGKMLFFTAINSLLTAICALILLFLVEFIFNASTNMTLLALGDYNHPLLKRLQLEAPGTFHHSLMVATLAEQAATAIGANPIKARVCALYHDIGKLIKPEYFIENGGAIEKHRELHPRMSSLIILNHVKEGVDLAIKYKLKRVIRDAIEQHHGTDIVLYFYKRALEESSDNTPVVEGEYRYGGPLPHDKEIVLVSLADACEAASRSLLKPSAGKIEALVWEILRKRVRDGQLDDAELSVKDLARLRDCFSKTLTTMLHGRIAYPKDEDEDHENDLFLAAQKSAAAESSPAEKPAQ